MTPDAGTFATTLTSVNGSQFRLEADGSVFGGVNIISSHETKNGWVHILDGIPSAAGAAVPEPRSLPFVMAGLFGLMVVRRRRK